MVDSIRRESDGAGCYARRRMPPAPAGSAHAAKPQAARITGRPSFKAAAKAVDGRSQEEGRGKRVGEAAGVSRPPAGAAQGARPTRFAEAVMAMTAWATSSVPRVAPRSVSGEHAQKDDRGKLAWASDLTRTPPMPTSVEDQNLVRFHACLAQAQSAAAVAVTKLCVSLKEKATYDMLLRQRSWKRVFLRPLRARVRRLLCSCLTQAFVCDRPPQRWVTNDMLLHG